MTRSSAFRSSLPVLSLGVFPGKRDCQMPRKAPATRLFAELAQRLAPRNSGSQFGETPAALSDPPNGGTMALEPNVGALLYLISLGAVAIATVVVFFGLGFFLLARPNEGLIAGPEARDRSVTIEARPPDLAPSPDKDGASSATQTASASSVSPAQPERHYGVLPPASDDTAPGSAIAADTRAAKATFGASAGQNVPQLGSNGGQAALATPAGITHAARAEIGRHRHAGARKHWARISQPGAYSRPPPAISGPERAWHWIVQSATGILASLSPPPSQPPPGFRTRWRAD